MFGYFLLFLDSFEILSQYPNTDGPHWFREDFKRIKYKVLREELMIKIASTLSFGNFLLNFWLLPVFVVVSIVNNLLQGPIDEI